MCAPAIVSVPGRLVVAGVRRHAEGYTLPLPVPLAPPVTVIHAALLAAVQAQPAPAVTALLPVPPAAAKASLVGEIEYGARAGLRHVERRPGDRQRPGPFVVAVFAATLKDAVPLPVPLAPPVTVIHAALLAAVQAQPAPAVTVLLPVPPPRRRRDWSARSHTRTRRTASR